MIESLSVPLAVLVAALVTAVCYQRRVPPTRAVLAVIFAVYLVFLIGVTFFPIPIDSSYIASSRGNQYLHNQFVPLATLRELSADGSTGFVRNIVGNLILLTPFAALLPIFNQKVKTLFQMATITLAFSLSIELTQLGISTIYGFTYKIFDVDDIWLNTLGALPGYFAYLASSRHIPSIQRTLQAA